MHERQMIAENLFRIAINPEKKYKYRNTISDFCEEKEA